MAMSMAGNGDGPMTEINTTPLIDVMLVLLIMLIITLPVMTHAVKVDLPIGPDGETSPAVEVFVDFDGVVLWNGSRVDDMRDLENRLRALAESHPQPHLNVRADRRSNYEPVARVLAIAQRSGIKAIGIEGTN